jgi:hypothetical protein
MNKLGRLEIDDFMHPPAQICFNLCLEGMYLFKNDEPTDDGRSYEDFRDLLVKYDLQDYTDLLVEYQQGWINHQEGLKEGREKREDGEKNLRPHSLKVSKILKMFMTTETRGYRNLKISVSDLTNKIDTAGKELFDQLKVGYINEFERLGLNETELTVEEAKEEVEDINEDGWFDEYGCTAAEILSEPYYLEKYRLDHYKPRETTLEIVNKAIVEIEDIQKRLKKGVGAKVKNLGYGELAKRLSYLHRIRPYLDQKEFSSINHIPLSNETCRFIFDYLEFWGSLPEGVKFEKKEKEKRANYIKSLIRNNVNYFKKPYSFINTVNYVYPIVEDLENSIDLFKKVKDGLITPDEYYKIRTAPD